jgi:hypothetical protein
MFSASQNGIVAYRTRTLPELAWFDRSGKPLGSIGVAGDGNPALSHDGRRVAISRYDPLTATRSLWLLDLSQGGVASRLTSRTTWDTCPVWSFDDTKIVFARGAPNQGQLHEMSATGIAQERVVPLRAKGCPGDWSRDGRYLLYGVNTDGGSPGSLWVLPVGEHADPIPLDGTAPFGPRGPRGRISPNGRWLAYEAETSGRREIYVRSFPDGAGGSWQISSEGGIEPQWRGDGRELFFLGADKRMMAVPVTTDGAFRARTPMALFSTELDPLGLPITGRNQYQVAADGQRFLMNQPRGEGAPSPVTVLVNWPEAVKRSSARLSHSTR